MFEAIGTATDGKRLRATGRTEREATQRLIRRIERSSGLRFGGFDQDGAMNFVKPETVTKLRERLPAGQFDCLCFQNIDGKLECVCRTPRKSCSCKDRSRCQCNGHTSFSERDMTSTEQPHRRRFTEGNPSRDDMLRYLADAGVDVSKLKDAPDGCLAEFCRLVGSEPDVENFAEKFSAAQRGEFAKIQQYVEKNRAAFERIAPGNADQILRVFGREVGKGATAAQLLGKGF